MAKKYIDADKLIAEIERRKEEYKEDRYMSDYRGQIAYYKDEIYDDLLHFIDSLQQEQSCDTCTNDKGCVTCKDGELWEGKEQPSEDLEAEMRRFLANVTPSFKDGSYRITRFGFRVVARHFAEWQKSKMLKDAVEGEVYRYESYQRTATAIIVDLPREGLGNKVKIVVIPIKED